MLLLTQNVSILDQFMAITTQIRTNIGNGMSAARQAIANSTQTVSNAVSSMASIVYQDFSQASQQTSHYLGLKNAHPSEQNPSMLIQFIQSAIQVVGRLIFIEPGYTITQNMLYTSHLLFNTAYDADVSHDDRDQSVVESWTWRQNAGQKALYYALKIPSFLPSIALNYLPTAIAFAIGISQYSTKSISYANQWHNHFNNEKLSPTDSIGTLFFGGALGIGLGALWINIGLARMIIGLNHRTGSSLANSFTWLNSIVFGDGRYQPQDFKNVFKGGAIAWLGSWISSILTAVLLFTGISRFGGEALHFANQWHTFFNNDTAQRPTQSITTLGFGGLLGASLGSIWIGLGLLRAAIGFNHRTWSSLNNSFAWLISFTFGKRTSQAQNLSSVLKGGIIAWFGSWTASLLYPAFMFSGISRLGLEGVSANMAHFGHFLWESNLTEAQKTRTWIDFAKGGLGTWVSGAILASIALVFSSIGFTAQAVRFVKASQGLDAYLNDDIPLPSAAKRADEYGFKTGLLGLIGASIFSTWGVSRFLLGLNQRGFDHFVQSWSWVYNRGEIFATIVKEEVTDTIPVYLPTEHPSVTIAEAAIVTDEQMILEKPHWSTTGFIGIVLGYGLATACQSICTIFGINQAGFKVLSKAYDIAYHLNNESITTTPEAEPINILKGSVAGIIGGGFILIVGIARAMLGLNTRSIASMEQTHAWHQQLNGQLQQGTKNDETEEPVNTFTTFKRIVYGGALGIIFSGFWATIGLLRAIIGLNGRTKDVLGESFTWLRSHTFGSYDYPAQNTINVVRGGLIAIAGSVITSMLYAISLFSGFSRLGIQGAASNIAHFSHFLWETELSEVQQTRTWTTFYKGGLLTWLTGSVLTSLTIVCSLIGLTTQTGRTIAAGYNVNTWLNDNALFTTKLKRDDEHFTNIIWKTGMFGVLGASLLIAWGSVRALFGFNQRGFNQLTRSWAWVNGLNHTNPSEPTDWMSLLKTGITGIVFGVILSIVTYVVCNLLGINQAGARVLSKASSIASIMNDQPDLATEETLSWLDIGKGSLVGVIGSLLILNIGLIHCVLGLNPRSNKSLEQADRLHTLWNTSTAPSTENHPNESFLTFLKGGVLGAGIGSIWILIGGIRAIIGLNSKAMKGAFEGITAAYHYLTSSLSKTSYDTIFSGGLLAIGITTAALAIAGTLSLIANKQSIVLFHFLRNFFSDELLTTNDLPSLALWRHENQTTQNMEKLLKQINLVSAALYLFAAGSVALYAAAVVTVFSLRIALYRLAYQGFGIEHCFKTQDDRLDALENYRDYLITHEVTDELSIQVLNTYQEEKKGFFSALWQDVTRAYRLHTQSIGEKVVQQVIDFIKQDPFSIDSSELYASFSSLDSQQLDFDEAGFLHYCGSNPTLQAYFSHSKITLEHLNLNNLTNDKKIEMTCALKHIGLFAQPARLQHTGLISNSNVPNFN